MTTLHTLGIEFDLASKSMTPVDLSTFNINESASNKIYWIHCDLSSNDLPNLANKLELPTFVTKICYQNELMPKLIDNGDALTMQVQCIEAQRDLDEEIAFSNLVFHLTPRYCFTASSQSLPVLTEFLETHARAIKYAKTPCFILFLILDNIINAYSESLLSFDEKAEQMDLRVRELHEESYAEILREEKQVMKIKRYISALQDILMRISGRKITVVSEQCRISLANLFNHTQVIVREAEAVRDILKGALGLIDNALIHRLNDTMRILTAFAAVFLPLSLIAGIYGMNFDWMPELHWKYGYYLVLVIMAVCGGFLWYIFKRKKLL